jgi:SAM-dependent methyltransferase
MQDNNKQKIKDSYNNNAKSWVEKHSMRDYIHTHIEKPVVLEIMGDIKGKKVLCIGCGDGQEANLFYERAAEIAGFDISEELIKIAKLKYPDIDFYVGDAESFSLNEKFDIAYAGFVAHYFPNYEKFLLNTSKLLKEKGELIFSIIHPIKRSLDIQIFNDRKYKILGNSKLADGSDQICYGDYLNSREVSVKLGEDFEPINYHTTVGQQINDILDSDFELLNFVEPKPIDSAKIDYPEKYDVDCKIPEVLIYHLRLKRGNEII